MTSPTPDQFFGGGGAPSAKFEKPGDGVRGPITDLEVVQQREFLRNGVGPLLYWGNDNKPTKVVTDRPVYQLNVTLQTTLRDPSIEHDDGKRRVYVKGKRLTAAVKKAFREAGAKGLEIGGEYSQTMTGYDPDSENPDNPAKEYTVTYARPVVGAQVFGDDEPASTPAAAAPAVQSNGNGATAPSGVDINSTVAAMRNLNLDDQTILASLTGQGHDAGLVAIALATLAKTG